MHVCLGRSAATTNISERRGNVTLKSLHSENMAPVENRSSETQYIVIILLFYFNIIL